MVTLLIAVVVVALIVLTLAGLKFLQIARDARRDEMRSEMEDEAGSSSREEGIGSAGSLRPPLGGVAS